MIGINDIGLRRLFDALMGPLKVIGSTRQGKRHKIMLTIQDCIDMCQLTEDEIAAVAEHEHVPYIVALEMGNYLCINTDGEQRLSGMIVDDIEAARKHGNLRHAAKLRRVLQHFLEHHAGVTLTDEQKSVAGLITAAARKT